MPVYEPSGGHADHRDLATKYYGEITILYFNVYLFYGMSVMPKNYLQGMEKYHRKFPLKQSIECQNVKMLKCSLMVLYELNSTKNDEKWKSDPLKISNFAFLSQNHSILYFTDKSSKSPATSLGSNHNVLFSKRSS